MPTMPAGLDAPVVAHRDLMALADMRLAEAWTLHTAGHHSGAFYLAGYAVELGLKSIMARDRFGGTWPGRDVYPAGYTHNLEELLKLANLRDALMADSRRDDELGENWQVVRRWRESARYAVYTAQRAASMVFAVRQNRSGVLPWLKSR